MDEMKQETKLSESIGQRTKALFEAHRQSIFKRTDRLFAGLMAF